MGKVASVMANGAGAVGWRQGLSWERKAKRRETVRKDLLRVRVRGPRPAHYWPRTLDQRLPNRDKGCPTLLT